MAYKVRAGLTGFGDQLGQSQGQKLPEKPLTTSAVRLKVPLDTGGGLESVYPGSALSLFDDPRMVSASAWRSGGRGDSGRSRSHESLFGWDDWVLGVPEDLEGSKVGSCCSPVLDSGDAWFGDLSAQDGGFLSMLCNGSTEEGDQGTSYEGEEGDDSAPTSQVAKNKKKKQKKQKKTKDLQQRPPPWLGVSYEFRLPRLTVTWIHQNEVVSSSVVSLCYVVMEERMESSVFVFCLEAVQTCRPLRDSRNLFVQQSQQWRFLWQESMPGFSRVASGGV